MRHRAVPTAAAFFPALLLSLFLALPAHAQPADEAVEEADPQAPEASGETQSSEAEGAAADPAAEAQQALEERIVAMRAQNSRMGPVGGIHVVDAGSGPAGSFRISLLGELMRKDDFLLPNDDNSYGGGVLALSVTPTEWLELSAALSARSLNNTGNPGSPGLLQSFGDLFVDVKGFREIKPGVTLGGDVGVWFLGGQNEVGKDLSATSALLRFNTSLDLREMTPKQVPMLMRFNLGYKFDNSARTVEALENRRLDAIEAERELTDVEFQHLATRVERFAFNINRVDMLSLGLGAEWPVETKRTVVSPLLEYTWGIPINRQGFTCPFPVNDDGEKLPGVDSCLNEEGLDTWPSTLTGGVSLRVKRLEGLRMTAAVDVGLSGMKNFVQELAPNAPYMIYLGAGYAVDVRPRKVVEVVEKTVEVPVEPPTGRVQGRVVEQGTDTPVEGARVHFAGTDTTDLYASDQGEFTSYAFAPDTEVEIQLSAEGYEDGTCSTTIPEPAADVELTCELKALPRVGSVRGLVIDAEGAPVPTVNVVLRGGAVTRVVTTSQTGHFEAQDLPPGQYTARIEHEGHLIKVEPVQIKLRQQTEPRIQLLPEPKRAQVRIARDRIVLRNKIYFAHDTAQIEPRSEELLAELADLLIRNPDILRVEVQGHTDNTGDPQHNLELSQERAEAVRQWLVDHGVEPDRLTAKGYGAQDAVAPNITERNRARNRRVELHIVQQLERSEQPAAAPQAPAE